MPISEAFSISSALISTTEWSLTNNSSSVASNTSSGIYQLILDTANMAAGDEFEFRILEKVVSSGSQRELSNVNLMGAQAGVYTTPSLVLMNGWDMTIQKIAGTDRNFAWSIRKVS